MRLSWNLKNGFEAEFTAKLMFIEKKKKPN